MESRFTFLSAANDCGYLPGRVSQLQCEVVRELAPGEYMERLRSGWRRFGHTLFRTACPACQRCQSLRVPVAAFRANRSQRRAWQANYGQIATVVAAPSVSPAKRELYRKFHRYQHEAKGWPIHVEDDVESFVDNPFATEEWCYYLRDRLIAVGYVDRLPEGLSAIYFYYDPDERDRSLGTFNVLSIIAAAREARAPHVYLGYYVEGCRSLEYKGRFRPNEVLRANGTWEPFSAAPLLS
jgi:leucyl-tRNA---protein transferase